ncbi:MULTISPECIES: Na+/H+ antiporter subunit E [Oceanobacillus]|uniref:Na+/H+ antiporter subunit E n=1 Tax=Oceanobacillus profundus TaxID=372463 RepID=A0A417YNB6_9BACI|nr:Na+/H+ antiporter subunit E [Oceanobacillus profundus]MCM3398489.1 Na+/H+ antiporter subunit E [Oceanobacillus profundus]PAE27244.1 Na+/H+ antiporter subunit E [Paenibacillus sp. 7884-2]RHW35312.1 Na+/H+ antiporter subunit E [Oceanobacillus profundus]
MPAQFLLNVFIAVLWTLISDETELKFTTLVTGYLVGIVIVFLMHRFFGQRFYLTRFFALVKLILIFNRELFHSTILVIRHILSPKIKIKPGIFKYETVLKGEWEVTALALLLTLTPGSVVMEVNPEGDTFYIHGMDVEESKDMLITSLGKFEKAIMEVTR